MSHGQIKADTQTQTEAQAEAGPDGQLTAPNARPRVVHSSKKGGGRARQWGFVLTLQPEPGVDPIRSLRWALKGLLRRHGLRCVDLHERRGQPSALAAKYPKYPAILWAGNAEHKLGLPVTPDTTSPIRFERGTLKGHDYADQPIRRFSAETFPERPVISS